MRAGLLLVAMLVLAGCGQPAKDPDNGGEASSFDGAAAMEYVRGLALEEDGDPRFRIPGTGGQLDGAAYLWEATDVPGWEREWQNFTGVEYQQLDRSAVSTYTTPGDYDRPGGRRGCTEAESAAVPGLPFFNLLAIRRALPPGAAGAEHVPLLLFGAHWDSQMHSDYDDDPAKRDLPDPGANDGASGVGVLLQLMRELEEHPPDDMVDVGVFFIDGEDGFFDCYPLAGSLYFAQNPTHEVTAFILLDMVGDPGALYPKELYSRNSALWLLDLVWGYGQQRGPEHFINKTIGGITDDHVALARAGIPSIDIIDAGRVGTFPPQWDTTEDTVDKLDADMLALVGDVLLDLLTDPNLECLLRLQDSQDSACL